MNNLSSMKKEELEKFIHDCQIDGHHKLANTLCELLARREVEGVPVAKVVSKFGDPEAFGEREIVVVADIQKLPYNTKLFTAPPLPVVPDGWALVPIEPTDEMCLAPDIRVGISAWDGYQSPADMSECKEIYAAMIAAAPKPEAK